MGTQPFRREAGKQEELLGTGFGERIHLSSGPSKFAVILTKWHSYGFRKSGDQQEAKTAGVRDSGPSQLDGRTNYSTNELTKSKTGSIHATDDRKAKEIGGRTRETKSQL